MTDLTLCPARKLAIEVRYNYNHTSLPWDDCVFDVFDNADLGLDDDTLAELIERLQQDVYTSDEMLPIIQEYLDRG